MALSEREGRPTLNNALMSVTITCSPIAVPIVEKTLSERGIFFGPSAEDEPQLPCEEDQIMTPDKVVFQFISSQTAARQVSIQITPQVIELFDKNPHEPAIWVLAIKPLDLELPPLEVKSSMFNTN